MKRTTVTRIPGLREMLAELERARKFILSGRGAGVQMALMDIDGKEAVSLCGEYRNNPEGAVKAIYKAVLLMPERGKEEKEAAPPSFRTSRA